MHFKFDSYCQYISERKRIFLKTFSAVEFLKNQAIYLTLNEYVLNNEYHVSWISFKNEVHPLITHSIIWTGQEKCFI